MLWKMEGYTAHIRVFCNAGDEPVTRLQHCLKVSQPILDLIVAVISVPLLVMLGLLLQTQLENQRSSNDPSLIPNRTISLKSTSLSVLVTRAPLLVNSTTINSSLTNETYLQQVADKASDTVTREMNNFLQNDAKWTLLGLSVAILIVTLLICSYVARRLGFCRGKKRMTMRIYEQNLTRQTSSVSQALSCAYQIYTEQPPTYDEVVINCYEIPPPEYEAAVKMLPDESKYVFHV